MVLDVTAEVGKKVKSAIKAKLTELGAYVDDELPDYIMILVGNKKTKDQMDDDLSLFLGHNTERFTSWLHHVLQKLNAASVLQKDAPKPVKEKEKKEDIPAENITPEVAAETEPAKPPEEKKKHKKKKDKSERKKEKKEKKKKKDKDKEREKHSKSHKKEKKLQAMADEKTETISASTSETKSATIVSSEKISKEVSTPEESQRKASPKSVDSAIDKDDDELHDDIVDLRPDAEDLALGLEDEPVVKKIKLKTQSKDSEAKEKQICLPTAMELRSIEIKVDNTNGREFSTRTDDSSEEEAPAPSVHDRLGPLPAQSSSPLGKRIINLREESSFPSSKGGEGIGRVVSSAIASAVKSVSGAKTSEGKPSKKLEARVRPLPSKVTVEEVDDVALPPIRVVSAIGSVVKRSHDNVPARVRPLPSLQDTEEEEVDDVALPPVRVVSAVGAVLKRSHNNDESDETEEPSTKRMAGVASKVEVAPRPRRPGSMQANTALILRAVADAHKSVNKPVKRSHEEKEEEPLRKEIYSRSYQERQSHRLGGSGPTDAKTVKKFAITVPNAVLKDRMETDKHTLGDDSLLEMEEEYILEEDGMKPEKVVTQQKVSVPGLIPASKVLPMKVDDDSGNTRFIVTMDGLGNEVMTTDLRSRISGRPATTPSIDEEEFIEEIEEWTEEIEEMEGEPTQGGIVPQRMAAATAAVASATATATAAKWKNKIDASGLTTKKEERCRFWPACKEGVACQYIHPSKICNTFPNCRFADKCIYIHPNCKFDSACTKPNCPFTHASSRNIALAQVATAPLKQKMIGLPNAKKIMCKYYPKCVDMNCTFYHPKQICRYGKACQMPSCIYIHPEVTTGSLLKWTAPKPPSSSSATSTVAVSTSTVAVSSTAPTLTTIAKPKAPISAL